LTPDATALGLLIAGVPTVECDQVLRGGFAGDFKEYIYINKSAEVCTTRFSCAQNGVADPSEDKLNKW